MPFAAPFVLPRRNHGCRVETELTLWGHRAVVIQNELIRVTVLAGKGADIVEFLYKPLDLDFMWANPSGPRAPEQVTPPPDPNNCFGDFYYGGWQELFPHGSRSTEVFGAQMVQHGEVWGLPWEVLVEEDRPDRVTVAFRTRTRMTPFVLEKRLTLRKGKAVLEIDETAHNLGRTDLAIMWGHHPAFGAPFLDETCTLYAPAKTVRVDLDHSTTWPNGAHADAEKENFSRMPARDSGVGRMLYLEDLRDGWYALHNPKLKAGFGMRWDHKKFPVVWIWQEATGKSRSPWFGHAYACAIEPFSHLPLARERGEELLNVPAGGKLSTRFLAFAFSGSKPVRNVNAAGIVS